jgi:P4 family phage/plasmid primase-like protien
LQGARLALCPETEKNSYWLESKLKQATGGDKLTARFMRGDYFDFEPQFKLFVRGNYRPRLRSVDEAIRRRMNIIPFVLTIPEGERDLKLADKLKTEWDAILGWMIEGCLEWQRDGLNPPDAVKLATEEYLFTQDKLGRWLDERCMLGANESATVTSAYDDYSMWCQSNGEKPAGKNNFSQELCERHGIEPTRHTKHRGYSGFSLLGDRPDENEVDSWAQARDRF